MSEQDDPGTGDARPDGREDLTASEAATSDANAADATAPVETDAPVEEDEEGGRREAPADAGDGLGETDEPDETDEAEKSDESNEPLEGDGQRVVEATRDADPDEDDRNDERDEAAASENPSDQATAPAGHSGDEPEDEPTDESVAAETNDRSARAQRRGAHARKVTPRERLRELIAPQANRTQALIALACLVLGFALSVQAKSTSQESSFNSLRQSELVGLLDRLNNRQDELRKETTRLEQDKAALERDDSGAARRAAQDREETLAILAGTEPATGPGIELVVNDPKGGVTASDLLGAVQELRDAGAEVLQIGQVRIAVDSYFVDAKDGVLVDDKLLQTPYRIKAIGDPHTMSTAMDIPGGVLETLHRAGAEGTVTKSQSVAVTAVRKS